MLLLEKVLAFMLMLALTRHFRKIDKLYNIMVIWVICLFI